MQWTSIACHLRTSGDRKIRLLPCFLPPLQMWTSAAMEHTFVTTGPHVKTQLDPSLVDAHLDGQEMESSVMVGWYVNLPQARILYPVAFGNKLCVPTCSHHGEFCTPDNGFDNKKSSFWQVKLITTSLLVVMYIAYYPGSLHHVRCL